MSLTTRDDGIATALAIRHERYRAADAIFAAGSLVRGEGTAFSDIDLVVVFPVLDFAYRESYSFGGIPVEAFVHDPHTLEYFFTKVDGPSGVPSLAQMVSEGVEMPEPTTLSSALKARATALLASGPPPLDDDAMRGMRYAVTDLLDDLRGARSAAELLGAAARLYDTLATFHLRSNGRWAAKGKAIPRALSNLNPDLSDRYTQCFQTAIGAGDPNPLIELGEEALNAHGGALFAGYRLDAPSSWRTPL